MESFRGISQPRASWRPASLGTARSRRSLLGRAFTGTACPRSRHRDSCGRFDAPRLDHPLLCPWSAPGPAECESVGRRAAPSTVPAVAALVRACGRAWPRRSLPSPDALTVTRTRPCQTLASASRLPAGDVRRTRAGRARPSPSPKPRPSAARAPPAEPAAAAATRAPSPHRRPAGTGARAQPEPAPAPGAGATASATRTAPDTASPELTERHFPTRSGSRFRRTGGSTRRFSRAGSARSTTRHRAPAPPARRPAPPSRRRPGPRSPAPAPRSARPRTGSRPLAPAAPAPVDVAACGSRRPERSAGSAERLAPWTPRTNWPESSLGQCKLEELVMAAPVEMWFGESRIGVKAGTKTYAQFRKYADVLFADLHEAKNRNR